MGKFCLRSLILLNFLLRQSMVTLLSQFSFTFVIQNSTHLVLGDPWLEKHNSHLYWWLGNIKRWGKGCSKTCVLDQERTTTNIPKFPDEWWWPVRNVILTQTIQTRHINLELIDSLHLFFFLLEIATHLTQVTLTTKTLTISYNTQNLKKKNYIPHFTTEKQAWIYFYKE